MKKYFMIGFIAVVLVSAVLSGCGKKSYFESAAQTEAGSTSRNEQDAVTQEASGTDTAPEGGETASGSVPNTTPQEVVVKVYVYNDSDAAVSVEGAQVTDKSGLIDINTATRDELMSLSGIGESRADAIISYRDEQGGFFSIEDLKKVSGIGDSTFEKIKEKITV